MEIIGLAIVIVIILLALLFAARFMITKKPDTSRMSFMSEEHASNTINTFLRTTARDCSKSSMEDLIQDCAQGTERICNDGKGACEYLRGAANEIFSQTFGIWKTNYYFLAYIDINSPFAESGSKCAANQGKVSKAFFVPVTAGTATVRLDICQ